MAFRGLILVTSLPLLLAAGLARPVATQQSPAATAGLPLEPTRPLRFTTTEGSWMSLDISPDGRTIVFDLLGDLYTLPIGGGTATRITSGQAHDVQPRFSPDGRRIVFVSDRSGADNLWLVDADGRNPHQLTRTTWFGYISPEWTPDGDYIVASRNSRDRNNGPFDLYLFHVAGGSGQRLIGAEGAGPGGTSYLGASFGADPRQIWLTRGTGYGASQLVYFDRQDGRVIQRTNRRPAGAYRPVLSPDGRWLVYATRRGAQTSLRLQDLATWDERWLVHDVQRDATEGGYATDLMPGMTFTPDSRALLASYGGKIWRVEVPSGQATEIRFTAEVDQMIGPLVEFEYPLNDSLLTVRHIREGRPSPDGRRIAFTALDRVWVADLPAPAATGAATIRNARRLTTLAASEHSPVWSPDGRTIAFVSWSPDGGAIHRVASTGAATPQRLTTDHAYYDKLAYSPDGTRLVFVRSPQSLRVSRPQELELGPAIGADLMWMPATGGTPARIATINTRTRFNPTYYGIPHFGPDPERVVIFDATEGLVSMRWDGLDRRVLVEATSLAWSSWATGPQEPSDEILLSPRGDRILIVGNQNLFLATMPTVGRGPTFSTVNRQGAALPMQRLTRAGGDFPGWTPDGSALYYSLGPAFFRHDLAAAEAARQDSVRRASAGDTARVAGGRAYQPARFDVAITVPRDRPTGALLLRGARLITMRGHEVIERGDLLVVNNRIAAVGPAGTVTAPAGARVMDMAGRTIMPGYVDIHAHMWPSWGVHRTEVWEYLANLAYGVTATRDPQTMTSDVIDYSDRVAIGDLLGPRIFTTARGVFASEEIQSLDDARDVSRRYSEFLQTETLKQYLVGDRRRRQWMAMANLEQRLTPTNEGGGDLRLNVTHMMDGYSGVEHSLPIFPLYNDVIQLAARSRTIYTPTLIVAYGGISAEAYFVPRYDLHAEPKLQRFWPREHLDQRASRYARWAREEEHGFRGVAEQAAKIVAAGGRVGLGAHGNLQGIGVHFELWALALGGMPAHDVLRAATIVGAEGIGHARNFGSLEVGKLADLQVLEGNPLQDIRQTNTVRQVMINGRLYDALTMDQVWPVARPLPRQWWMEP